MRNPVGWTCLSAALAVATLSPGALRAEGATFIQKNLVSDIPKLATITDTELLNPWGVSHGPRTPFWVSNQVTNTTTLYAVRDKVKVIKVPINPPKGLVNIPTDGGPPRGPTGQVFNFNPSSFPVKNGGDGGPAVFIFADLNGTISAWDGGLTAFNQVKVRGAVYTGLAINGAQTRLYAANTAGGGSVDVFDSAFRLRSLRPGAFVDPSLPKGLAPFNVEDIRGDVYVAYAPPARPAATHAALGVGAVAIFDENGKFIKQLIAGGRLSAPWGIALAPSGFGRFSNDLLVGNFSYLHSEINAFSPKDGKLIGTLPVSTSGHRPGGLWWIGFGVGGANGDPHTLYFSDGINGEADGLFGAIFSQ